jgi:FkbM family methyltransferase
MSTRLRVISFEPLPRAYDELARLRREFPGRFDCFNCGIADRVGLLDLHFGAEDSPHASFSGDVNAIDYVGRSNVNLMQVPVRTLDEFLDAHFPEGPPEIALLKIDTEGFEREVLCGARETIARVRPKFVQIEFNLHQLFRSQSLVTLSSYLPGYTAFQLLPHGRGWVRRDVRDPLANVFLFSNFVFVRHDVSI